MERSQFEALIKEVIARLPRKFRDRIENLEWVVEDFPGPEVEARFKSRAVLGLYHGVPLRRRGVFYGNILPDRIIIYQKVIEGLCPDESRLPELVSRVVLHELGHYFGLSETQLRALKY
jgi:predicted Zn-dependent protease with MMP-like domain